MPLRTYSHVDAFAVSGIINFEARITVVCLCSKHGNRPSRPAVLRGPRAAGRPTLQYQVGNGDAEGCRECHRASVSVGRGVRPTRPNSLRRPRRWRRRGRGRRVGWRGAFLNIVGDADKLKVAARTCTFDREGNIELREVPEEKRDSLRPFQVGEVPWVARVVAAVALDRRAKFP